MYKVAFDKEGKLQQGKEDMQLRRKTGKKKAIDPRVARAKLVLQAIERSDMEAIAVSREPVSVSAAFAQLGRLERLLHVTSVHEEHILRPSIPCRYSF